MTDESAASFSHLNDLGEASMVDVGDKPATRRRAVAEGEIIFAAETIPLLRDHRTPKGDIFTVAKIAGIMAAKRTSELIPLCHPLPLNHVTVTFELQEAQHRIIARAEAETTGKTGVEMEALTAVSVALLTLYDMTKSADKTMVLGNIRLLSKEGGKSGTFTRRE